MTTPLDLAAIRARLQAGCNCGWGGPPGHDASCPCAAAESYARTDVGALLDECERLRKERDQAVSRLAEQEAEWDAEWKRLDAESDALAENANKAEDERDAALAEVARLSAELDATTESRDQAERGARDLSLEVTRIGNDLRLAHDERDVARRSLKHERAQVDALRAERLAEDAVVEAAMAEGAAWHALSDEGANPRSRDAAMAKRRLGEAQFATVEAVDALRAARAGKEGG